jgi:hypothetical protein
MRTLSVLTWESFDFGPKDYALTQVIPEAVDPLPDRCFRLEKRLSQCIHWRSTIQGYGRRCANIDIDYEICA